MSEPEIRGILQGLALGDALGWPVEFSSRDRIQQQYGSLGILDIPRPAIVTDDTQMTLAVAEAMVDAQKSSPDQLIYHIANRFLEWGMSPENNRAPGNACMTAVNRLALGKTPHESGIENSEGCGTAMRVAPIGYVYQHDPEKLREVALESSIVTHKSSVAQASAVAAAYMVKLGLDGLEPGEMLTETIKFAGPLCPLLTEKLELAGELSKEGINLDNMGLIGEGWRGHEAVALSWYCVNAHPDDWFATVHLAVNGLASGDRDSIGCIAGGIQAARLGEDSIPSNWKEQIESKYSDEITDLSKSLSELRASLSD